MSCEGKAGYGRVVKCRNDSSTCQRKEIWMQESRGMVPVKVGRIGLQWCTVSQQQRLSAGMYFRTAACGESELIEAVSRRKVDRGPFDARTVGGEEGSSL